MLKRFFDIVFSSLALILSLPIILIVVLLVLIKFGRPVFFIQKRAGLMGRSFEIYKFRTMNSSVDDFGKLLPDSKRLTRIGIMLRSASIDELPSLWNVLVGEMSIVGPRPLLLEYLPLYNTHQARRHEVKPGITGWAQVNGRNEISWEKKFDLDVWYIDNQSLLLDLKIILMTIQRVVFRVGITAEGESTMSKFTGNFK